jgi:alanine dehydrogenase
MTLILTAADVAELLTFDECIDAVERAFRAHGEGKLHPPGVLSTHADRGAFHTKTASVGGYFAAKTNANFPSNAPLPTIQGVLLLFDEANGIPLAVMDSIEITARRTAAATAVAAKYLARRDAHVVEIYGCGKQGYAQLEALSRVIKIEDVIAHDVNQEAAQKLSKRWRTAASAVHVPDIIVTCTTSKKAFLATAPPGAFIAAVGADNPEKSEIAPELMRSSTIVTDVTEQARTIGDLHHAPGATVHAELGAIVAGIARGRASDDEVIIFDSTGVGFQDAAAAAIVHERAKERGRGTEVRFA